jgi:hypothetical protein
MPGKQIAMKIEPQKVKTSKVPKKYRGYKTHSNWKCRNFNANHTRRVIEYNLEFANNLTDKQIIFALEWCIVSKKIKDIFLCDKKTFARCEKYGVKKEDVIGLFERMQTPFKAKRMFNLMTESIEKHEQKKPFAYLWKKIMELIRHPLG